MSQLSIPTIGLPPADSDSQPSPVDQPRRRFLRRLDRRKPPEASLLAGEADSRSSSAFSSVGDVGVGAAARGSIVDNMVLSLGQLGGPFDVGFEQRPDGEIDAGGSTAGESSQPVLPSSLEQPARPPTGRPGTKRGPPAPVEDHSYAYDSESNNSSSSDECAMGPNMLDAAAMYARIVAGFEGGFQDEDEDEERDEHDAAGNGCGSENENENENENRAAAGKDALAGATSDLPPKHRPRTAAPAEPADHPVRPLEQLLPERVPTEGSIHPSVRSGRSEQSGISGFSSFSSRSGFSGFSGLSFGSSRFRTLRSESRPSTAAQLGLSSVLPMFQTGTAPKPAGTSNEASSPTSPLGRPPSLGSSSPRPKSRLLRVFARSTSNSTQPSPSSPLSPLSAISLFTASPRSPLVHTFDSSSSGPPRVPDAPNAPDATGARAAGDEIPRDVHPGHSGAVAGEGKTRTGLADSRPTGLGLDTAEYTEPLPVRGRENNAQERATILHRQDHRTNARLPPPSSETSNAPSKWKAESLRVRVPAREGLTIQTALPSTASVTGPGPDRTTRPDPDHNPDPYPNLDLCFDLSPDVERRPTSTARPVQTYVPSSPYSTAELSNPHAERQAPSNRLGGMLLSFSRGRIGSGTRPNTAAPTQSNLSSSPPISSLQTGPDECTMPELPEFQDGELDLDGEHEQLDAEAEQQDTSSPSLLKRPSSFFRRRKKSVVGKKKGVNLGGSSHSSLVAAASPPVGSPPVSGPSSGAAHSSVKSSPKLHSNNNNSSSNRSTDSPDRQSSTDVPRVPVMDGRFAGVVRSPASTHAARVATLPRFIASRKSSSGSTSTAAPPFINITGCSNISQNVSSPTVPSVWVSQTSPVSEQTVDIIQTGDAASTATSPASAAPNRPSSRSTALSASAAEDGPVSANEDAPVPDEELVTKTVPVLITAPVLPVQAPISPLTPHFLPEHLAPSTSVSTDIGTWAPATSPVDPIDRSDLWGTTVGQPLTPVMNFNDQASTGSRRSRFNEDEDEDELYHDAKNKPEETKKGFTHEFTRGREELPAGTQSSSTPNVDSIGHPDTSRSTDAAFPSSHSSPLPSSAMTIRPVSADGDLDIVDIACAGAGFEMGGSEDVGAGLSFVDDWGGRTSYESRKSRERNRNRIEHGDSPRSFQSSADSRPKGTGPPNGNSASSQFGNGRVSADDAIPWANEIDSDRYRSSSDQTAEKSGHKLAGSNDLSSGHSQLQNPIPQVFLPAIGDGNDPTDPLPGIDGTSRMSGPHRQSSSSAAHGGRNPIAPIPTRSHRPSVSSTHHGSSHYSSPHSPLSNPPLSAPPTSNLAYSSHRPLQSIDATMTGQSSDWTQERTRVWLAPSDEESLGDGSLSRALSPALSLTPSTAESPVLNLPLAPPIVQVSDGNESPTEEDIERAQQIMAGDETEIQMSKAAAYLGDASSVNARTRIAFLALFDFTRMSILSAFRQLCSAIALRAESQQLDRLISAFSDRWAQCNPRHGFRDNGVVHAISFSILMLNTDLHMADVGAKMTQKQFVKNVMPALMNDSENEGEVSMMSIDPEKGERNDEERDDTLVVPDRKKKHRLSRLGEDTPDIDSDMILVEGRDPTKRWEASIESVLRHSYVSIQKDRLPLHVLDMSFSPGSPLGGPSGANLGVNLAALRRTPSVLSRNSEAGASSLRTVANKFRRVKPGRASLDESRPIRNNAGDMADDTASVSNLSTNNAARGFGFVQAIREECERVPPVERSGSPGCDTSQEDRDLLATLQLTGPPWGKEGVLAFRSYPEKSSKPSSSLMAALADRKSKFKNWSDMFVVVQRGTLYLFSFGAKSVKIEKKKKKKEKDGSVTPVSKPNVMLPGGGNWADDADLVAHFSLQHAVAAALPAPFAPQRAHVWSLTLPSNQVHLFHAGSAGTVSEWVWSVNYWASRISRPPLLGGVSNVEYGWGGLDTLVDEELEDEGGLEQRDTRDGDNETATVHEHRPSSSVRSFISDHSFLPRRHRRIRSGSASAGMSPIPSAFSNRSGSTLTLQESLAREPSGPVSPSAPQSYHSIYRSIPTKTSVSEWTPPVLSMAESQLTEEQQLQALESYLRRVEVDLDNHHRLRRHMVAFFAHEREMIREREREKDPKTYAHPYTQSLRSRHSPFSAASAAVRGLTSSNATFFGSTVSLPPHQMGMAGGQFDVATGQNALTVNAASNPVMSSQASNPSPPGTMATFATQMTGASVPTVGSAGSGVSTRAASVAGSIAPSTVSAATAQQSSATPNSASSASGSSPAAAAGMSKGALAATAARAMANWERKSKYLVSETLRFNVYVDALRRAEQEKQTVEKEFLEQKKREKKGQEDPSDARGKENVRSEGQ